MLKLTPAINPYLPWVQTKRNLRVVVRIVLVLALHQTSLPLGNRFCYLVGHRVNHRLFHIETAFHFCFCIIGLPIGYLIAGGVFTVLLLIFVVVEGVQCCQECCQRRAGQREGEDTELLISTPVIEEEQHVSWREKLGASLDAGLYKVFSE